MNSIKKKLFFQIGSIVVFIVALMILANTLLLEPYYTSKQKNKLIDYYNTINSMNLDNYDDNLKEFLSIENTSNIDIVIVNCNKEILYASKSYMMDKKMFEKFMNFNILFNDDAIAPPDNGQHTPPLKITKIEKFNDKTSFIWASDNITENQALMLSGTLDNEKFIELRIHLEAIKTNIKLANSFLIVIGIVAFIIAIIFAYVISKHFTKPIMEINDATNRMKNLDFETSCQVTSNDEIGQLSQSINEMSTELSNKINTLNDKNTELENEIKEKEELNEKRRTLLNNVSHELKTPLALMQGYSEGLKLNITKNKEKSDFYCDVIIDETSKMNRLVESLLNIDQMEFGDTTLNKMVFEVNKFILSITKKYERIIQEKNIQLKVNTIERTKVFGDNFMLERVFENYLTNAISYVDENLKIEISLSKIDNHIRIEVFNTTPAISKQDLEKIWNTFYKIDKARTREKGGHGLGLSIVSSIQKAHNNDYGVKNIDKGVCFWFNIDIDV